MEIGPDPQPLAKMRRESTVVGLAGILIALAFADGSDRWAIAGIFVILLGAMLGHIELTRRRARLFVDDSGIGFRSALGYTRTVDPDRVRYVHLAWPWISLRDSRDKTLLRVTAGLWWGKPLDSFVRATGIVDVRKPVSKRRSTN